MKIDYKQYKEYKEIPNREGHNCIGCSPQNDAGLQMRFFTGEDMVFSPVVVPPHLCGWENLLHGGVISIILDEVMSWGAIYLLQRIIFTKTMTVDFLKPLHVETELRAEGRVLEEVNEREAVMEGRIYNSAGELCAQSTGKFALFTLDAMRKMGILNEKVIQNFETVFKNRERL
ncbi:MAG: PaaI family thioesterase [bacterium]|nr:PaaI family thioesterase [bacterium]